MITFQAQDIRNNLRNRRQIAAWIKSIIREEGWIAGDISFVFCSDNFLSEMNVKYLKHKTLTDIITFNYNEGKRLSGDIFISIERIEENARKFKTAFSDELSRVMIHGILHLAGYNDHTEEETKVMRQKEEFYKTNSPVKIS